MTYAYPAAFGGSSSPYAIPWAQAKKFSDSEPFSNWIASFGEEGMVLGGLWAMLASPLVFLGLLVVSLIVAGFVLVRLWGFVGRLFRRV